MGEEDGRGGRSRPEPNGVWLSKISRKAVTFLYKCRLPSRFPPCSGSCAEGEGAANHRHCRRETPDYPWRGGA